MKKLKSFTGLSYFLALFLITSFAFISCEDSLENDYTKEIALDFNSARMTVGDEMVITPLFQSPFKEYKWEVSDPEVIVISSVGNDNSATIKAIGEGTATATIIALDGSGQASTTIETTLIRETKVELPSEITAYTRATVNIVPNFDLVDLPTRSYTWTADPEGIISFEVNPETYEVEIQGLTPGTTELTLTSDDGEVFGSTTVTVEDENDGVLKVLAIGNSFSEDAIEHYLYGLANAAGEEIVIGNLYIGGAELALHLENATNNENSYSYRKINLSGNKTTSADVALSTALADENWDYISFQQVSQESGKYETFVESLPALYEYVSERTDEGTKFLLHQTWAYAENSTHSGFANYNNDQMTMFTAIVDAYDRAQDLIPVYSIVPSGTAIQNARTSYLGDNFTRDGYHLNELGRYTAASTWFEVLFDQSVIGNTYMPAGFVPIDVEIAQHAAHEAVQNPGMITELTEYQDAGGSGVITEDVLIDFSTSSNSSSWNGMTSYLEGATIPNLTDVNDLFTGIEMSITSRFNGQNTNGEKETNTSFNMPAEVSGNSFFGNSKKEWSGMLIEKGVLKLTGFKDNSTYEFCFFGSRTATDNRETQYTVIGESTGSAVLNTASNSSNIACVQGIRPDSNGEITIEVSAGPNNDNSYGFFYLNAMRISPE